MRIMLKMAKKVVKVALSELSKVPFYTIKTLKIGLYVVNNNDVCAIYPLSCSKSGKKGVKIGLSRGHFTL